MLYPDARILLFAKAPEPGRVKTRLVPALSVEAAAGLYARMLDHTVAMTIDAAIAPLECSCAPDARHPFFQHLAQRYALMLSSQAGADLGERMANAARGHLAGGVPVVLIGGDVPALRPRHLIEALRQLHAGSDAVVAPAEDGGYVMLALRRFDHSLFTDMAWGSDSVLAVTRQRLAALGWRWQETETLWDLDRAADLSRLEPHQLRWLSG
ncbi:MAG: TIGR04282 family arsenosugar biosynthesis glycosyltransferase [Gammaproteobacteria bacterium]|nr:TIGR04282 family arsenosugar biosynthesis glycosyltransferase [Gammaproteobacteria bacterium]